MAKAILDILARPAWASALGANARALAVARHSARDARVRRVAAYRRLLPES